MRGLSIPSSRPPIRLPIFAKHGDAHRPELVRAHQRTPPSQPRAACVRRPRGRRVGNRAGDRRQLCVAVDVRLALPPARSAEGARLRVLRDGDVRSQLQDRLPQLRLQTRLLRSLSDDATRQRFIKTPGRATMALPGSNWSRDLAEAVDRPGSARTKIPSVEWEARRTRNSSRLIPNLGIELVHLADSRVDAVIDPSACQVPLTLKGCGGRPQDDVVWVGLRQRKCSGGLGIKPGHVRCCPATQFETAIHVEERDAP